MEISPEQQIFDLLRKANKILIALPEALTTDAVAGGLALKLFLQKLQKDVELASSGKVEEILRFLGAHDAIKPDITLGKSLVVRVDTSVKKLEEISYQTENNQALIYLKAMGQAFDPADLSFSSDKFPVDAIVTLSAPSLGSLGKLFEMHADLFYETPKINIDHKAANELYGAINLVDVTATSVAEILAGLLEQFEASLLDRDIATALLAGIIAKTNSFQHSQTTPQAFLKASKLVSLGGRQQEIIKNFYKTKSLALLKLWGRCLARLKTSDEFSLAYTVLNKSDFEKTGATPDLAEAALKEFVENLSSYKLAGILAETEPGQFIGWLAAHSAIDFSVMPQALPEAKESGQTFGMYKIYSFSFGPISQADAEHKLRLAAEALLKNFHSA